MTLHDRTESSTSKCPKEPQSRARTHPRTSRAVQYMHTAFYVFTYRNANCMVCDPESVYLATMNRLSTHRQSNDISETLARAPVRVRACK